MPSQSPATSDADDCDDCDGGSDGADELIDMQAAGTSNLKCAAQSVSGSHRHGYKYNVCSLALQAYASSKVKKSQTAPAEQAGQSVRS